MLTLDQDTIYPLGHPAETHQRVSDSLSANRYDQAHCGRCNVCSQEDSGFPQGVFGTTGGTIGEVRSHDCTNVLLVVHTAGKHREGQGRSGKAVTDKRRNIIASISRTREKVRRRLQGNRQNIDCCCTMYRDIVRAHRRLCFRMQ